MSGQYPPGQQPQNTMATILQFINQAEQFSKQGEYDKEVGALMSAVKVAQANQWDLSQAPQQGAEALDHIAMNLYKHSQEAVAISTEDMALYLMPSYVPAMHHKAIFLVAMNREIEVALGLLDHALNYSPNDKTIWGSKGDALKVLGKPQDAIDCYLHAQQLDATSTQYVDKALKIQAGNPQALQMKLGIAIRMGGTSEAINTCKALIQTNPNEANLQFTLANLLVNSGRYDEALGAVEMALRSQPDNPTYLFAKARILRETQRYKEASDLYRLLLNKRVETSPAVLQEVADALDAKQLDQELVIALRLRILELDPRNLANIQSLRSVAVARSDRELSLKVYDAWLTLSPHNLEAESALAQLFADEGDIEKSLATYSEVARYHPDEVRYIRKGLELSRKHHLNDRLVTFASYVLAKEPNDATTMEWLEDAYAELGRWRDALAITDRLLHSQPNSASYLKRKKACLVALGMHNEVPAILDQIFDEDPSAYDIAIERAKMYHYWAEHAPAGSPQRDSWSKEALRSFERASLSPELHGDCLMGMAKTYRLVRRLDKADEAYSNLLAMPGNEKRADILKERGHVLRELARNSDALDSYQKAVEAGCDDIDLLWGLAEVLRSLNENAKAIHYLEILTKREPRNPLFLRRYGRMLTQTDRRQEGFANLKAALALQEKDPSAYFELADSLKEAGAYQDALGYYQQGLKIEPGNQLAHLSFIETLILTGRIPEAIREIDGLLRKEPSNARVWMLRMEAYKFLRNDDEILYSLKAILTLSPSDSVAWEEKHRIHMERGDKKEAFDAVTSLITTTQKTAEKPKYFLTRGDLASDLGMLDEALKSYDDAAKGDPTLKFETDYRKARALGENDKPEDALKILDGFGEPPFPSTVSEHLSNDILTLRGALNFDLGHFTESLEIFEELLKKDPRNVDQSLWKARALLELGKHRDAKSFLDGSIPTFSTPSADAYLYLSEAESGVGSHQDAIAACMKGLQINPSNVDLLIRLGDLRSRDEKWQEAGDAYARAVSVDKNDPDAHYKIGLVHEKLGHQNEAIREYKEAVRLEPKDPHSRLSLGLLLLDVGQPEEAQSSIDEALRLDPQMEAALEAKKVAQQKIREKQIEMYGKKALLLSAQGNRPVSRNDLFMTLQVPWDLIDPVMREVSKVVEIDISKLSDNEIMDLEGMSYQFIVMAMERHLPNVDRGNLTLADLAILSPPDYDLKHIQRLMGYIQSALTTQLRPETLKLTRDIEDLARKALTYQPAERTPFKLVKNLRIGLYKAMIIKAIETMTMDMRATSIPTASVPQPPPPPPAPISSPQPTMAPPPPPSSQPAYQPPPPQTTSFGDTTQPPGAPPPPPAEQPAEPLTPAPEGARCSGCGGPATYTHTCGANVCRHCIVQYSSCPKCSLTLSLPSDTSSTTTTFATSRPSSTMDMPMAFVPASKRMDDQDAAASGAPQQQRSRRLMGKPRSRTTTSSSSDEDAHL